MTTTTLIIHAVQKAQPRLRPTNRGGRLGVYMPKTADGYRQAIMNQWRSSHAPQYTGPIEVSVYAAMPLPKSKKKMAGKPHTSKPDGDNLLKSILDALTKAGAWGDDSHVYQMSIIKMYCHNEPHTRIDITGETA